MGSSSRPTWTEYRLASSQTRAGCPAVRVYWWGLLAASTAASAREAVAKGGGSQLGKPWPRLAREGRSAANRPNSLQTVGPVERPRREMASPTREGEARPSPEGASASGSEEQMPSKQGAGSMEWKEFISSGWAERAERAERGRGRTMRPDEAWKAETELKNAKATKTRVEHGIVPKLCRRPRKMTTNNHTVRKSHNPLRPRLVRMTVSESLSL
mmetsp:Transcript_12570/g.27775  ORF Transcript_12570/g.27775 Transcript_12570/m.27775 type:complete len:214 (+) Transcript_12570:1520-2161(+)